MRKIFHAIHKRPALSRNELLADALFITLSAFLSFVVIFIFDIHHTFYAGHDIFKPEFIFKTKDPYIIGILLGSLIGFFVFKILVYGIMLEEKALIGERPPAKKR